MQGLDSLNDAQRRAVAEGDGPVLVLAGAGTGKTRVIIERLAWLVDERGIDPRSMLAVTFTNRAAREMRERAAARLNMDRFGAWIGTFHSFGLTVLRREIGRLGRNTAFTIFDDTDQLSLMKRLIKEMPEAAGLSPRGALGWISRLKQDLRAPGDDAEPGDEVYRALWGRYHAALERASALDYDDLLVLTARLLEQHEDVRDRYSRRYRYVHVDEYQDTNHAQYRIAVNLAKAHGNLFVVGDEDQSIYSWRGADISNILNFEKDFPGAKVFRLEQNYRSTEPILTVANAVVAHNASRLGKTLWTAEKGGDAVRFYLAETGDDEARFVAEALRQAAGVPGGAAVLYRTVAQSRLIEEALRRIQLPYVMVGGIQFYARKEVKDVLAYLRLLVNPDDDESLRRVINTPPRGIGAATLEHIGQYARNRGTSLFRVLREIDQDQTLGARARDALAAFVHLIDDLLLAAKESSLAALTSRLLEKTGYENFVRESDEKDLKSRLEILEELVSACGEFDARGGGGVGEFLQELALFSELDSYEAGAPPVTLMTCHAAKGLEFGEVFLIGFEQGLLPHASALNDDHELEEERRLCYVAMTRARRRLTLSAAQMRMQFGETARAEPSQFLKEIPRNLLDVLGPVQGAPAVARAVSKPSATPPTEGGLRTGVRVWHATFGKGTVMSASGSGSKLKVRVRFDTGRSRDLMAAAAPLQILEGERKR